MYPCGALMAFDASQNDDVIYFGEYLSVLRRRKWWVLAAVLLGLVAAAAYYKTATRSFTSTAKVQTSTILPGQQAAGQKVDLSTETAFVTSADVAKCAELLATNRTFEADPTSATFDPGKVCTTDALQKAKLELGPVANVKASPIAQSAVFTIQYTGRTPKQAQLGAQAFAVAYVQIKTVNAQAQLDQLRAPLLSRQSALTQDLAKVNAQVSDVLTKIAQTPPGSRSSGGANQAKLNNLEAQRTGDQQQLNAISQQLLQLDPSKINPPSVTFPGQVPQAPSSPSKTIAGGVGLVLGLILGVAVAFVRDRVDDRIRGREDVEATLGVPVLAIIPHIASWRRREETHLIVSEQPKGSVAEAYRTLRTSMMYLAGQRNAKVIMVSGPGVGEGKTTTSSNLAVALALAGKRVILVSGDLRKPRLHRFFGVDNDAGLSSVLAGEAEPWTVMKTPPIDNLRVIASGPVPQNPAELIESGRMASLIDRLREVADFVIIDTAPVLLVSDPMAIARDSDAVVLVVDAHGTHRGALAHAREQLESAGANLVGAIMNDFDPSKAKAYGSRYYGRYYYPYGYRYSYGYGGGRYGYGAEPENGSRRPRREVPAELSERERS